MEVKVVKIVIRSRVPYRVPAKYSSNTKTLLYIDRELKGEFLNGAYGGFKNLMKLLKKKYSFTDYIKEDGGTIYKDY